MRWLLVPLLLTGFAMAANPKDEQVVRNAYAKVAYAVQSRTVYMEALKNPKLTSLELAQKLQANELRFEIADMSSGTLSDIDSRPYTDFVTPPDGRDVLSIAFDTATFNEKGTRFTSNFAASSWVPDSPAQGDWGVPVKEIAAKERTIFSRYVTARITVQFQGQSRTYRALWLFGSDIRAIDLVTGDSVLRDFALQSAYPSVLTDTSLRSRLVVSNWLSSTQQFGSSCKTGKQDVCCDSTTMRCGVPVEDLQSTKPAPSTTAVPKGGL